MEAKHTPGPWTYEYGAVYHAEKGRLILADRDNPNTSPTERDANMRFCAVGPDLLEALEEIKRNCEPWNEADKMAGRLFRIADFAIRKARGEA